MRFLYNERIPTWLLFSIAAQDFDCFSISNSKDLI